MGKDTLLLLKPSFQKDGAGPYFCAGCAMVEGMLSFYPALRASLDVEYLDYPRPRPRVVAEVGEANQSLPVLILEADAPAVDGIEPKAAHGKRFLDDENLICAYLGRRHRLGVPH